MIDVSVFVPVAVRLPTSPIDATFATSFTLISGSVTPGFTSACPATPFACVSFAGCVTCAYAWPAAAAQSIPFTVTVIARCLVPVVHDIFCCSVLLAACPAGPFIKERQPSGRRLIFPR